MEVIEYGNHRDTDSYGYAMFLQDTHGGPADDGFTFIDQLLRALEGVEFFITRCPLPA